MKAALALFLALALPAAVEAAEGETFKWNDNWPKFRKTEYAVTGFSLAGAAANYYLVPPPKTPVWKGPILFDKAARNTLLIRSEAAQNQAQQLSDVLTYPLMGYAILDGPITVGWAGGNKDAAIQLALINAETMAVTEVLNLTVSNFIPRRRPDGATCGLETKYDPHCVKSFWSGHAANVFAAASLVCAQHGALDLYGGKSDTAVCVTALGVASFIGVLRIAGNNHYASDVMIGAVVGAGTGYVMPNLLHFHFGKSRRELGALIPNVGPDGGGLTYVKAW